MRQNNFNYEKKALPAKFGTIAMIFSVLGLILTVLAFVAEPIRAAFDSIIVFVFLMGLGLCAVFLLGIEYLTGAVWSVVFRRIGEFIAPLIGVSLLFAIPVLFNMHSVFHWTHTEVVNADKVLTQKAPYLNEPFFFIRLAAVVAITGFFAWLIIRNSKKQDTSKLQSITTANIKLSAIFMPIFGISITVISIDWIMSLEPHWFSTIFGVYYFAGSLLSTFALITLFALYLKKNAILPNQVKSDHFYNLGAFMFAFVNFWSYIAFSQFMLIWYANQPEETFWFMQRTTGTWLYVSLGIILINFLIPYATLLPQPAKSSFKTLKFMGVWLLFAHYYDLYWLIMPTFSKAGASISWVDFGFPILAVGLVMLTFKYSYNKNNLIPIGDPKLNRSLDFHL